MLIAMECMHIMLGRSSREMEGLCLTEETRNGWLVRLGALVMPGRMSKWHQRWLEELEKVAGKAALVPPDR